MSTPTAPRARFFPGGQEALRARLAAYLEGLGSRLAAESFAPEVAFLLLAGGYGRGEGGVWEEAGSEPRLYNDLEFYLVLRAAGAGYGAAEKWCAHEAHSGEEQLGLEVEFKILTLPALRAAEPTMFYYDLLSAHELVFGEAALVASLPARLRDPAALPAHEGTRLLFNRGTGLWFCQQALAEGSARVQDGFIERNHAKARLALADAVLALNGRYHFSCRTRAEHLAEPLPQVPPHWEQLRAWHEEAVHFKFHPQHSGASPAALAEEQQKLVAAWQSLFLWLEGVRLRQSFSTPAAYASYRGSLFPGSSKGRNLLLHARDRWRRGAAPRGWLDYPRAPLQRALALLLAGDREGAAKWLALAPGAPLAEVARQYERWWRFYN